MRETIRINENVILYVKQLDTLGKTFEFIVEYSGTRIYRKDFTRKEVNMYKIFIIERLEILFQDCGKLHNDYVMVEVGNRMYKLDDLDYNTKNDLKRSLYPCDYKIEESFTFDVLIDSSLHDYFTYKEGALVYKFGNFYLNGLLIHNGIPSEFSDRDFEFSISDEAVEYFEELSKMKIVEYHGVYCRSYFKK